MTFKHLLLMSALALGPALNAAHDHGAMAETDALKSANRSCLIVNRDSSDVGLLDMETLKTKRIALDKFANPHMGMISHDGKTLVVSGSQSNKIYLIDVLTSKIVAEIPAYGEPEHMDITPDSHYAFVGSMHGGVVQAIDLTTYKEAKAIDGFSEPHGYSTLPDGSKIYISNLGAHEVTVIDIARLEVLKRISVGAPTEAASMNPGKYLAEINGIVNPTLSIDGKFCYAADGDFGLVAVIDTRTDKLVASVQVGEKPWRGYASPDGKYILVPVNGEQVVAVIEVGTHKLLAKMPSGPDMTGINYVQGGKKAYAISSSTGTLYKFDLRALEPSGKVLIGANLVLETATTDREGKKVYLCSSTDDSIYIVDGETDKLQRISNVGDFPWGSHIMGSNDNYCH